MVGGFLSCRSISNGIPSYGGREIGRVAGREEDEAFGSVEGPRISRSVNVVEVHGPDLGGTCKRNCHNPVGV